MTDQTVPQIDNVMLRFMISEAVQREVATVVAPLRNTQQIIDGTLKQMNRDLAQYQLQATDLDELVRGNPKQNLIGLAEQIKQQNGKIDNLNTTLTAQIAKVAETHTNQINTVIAEQTKAKEGREAIKNQITGAKYAFGALALFTGITQYDQLAKLATLLFG